MLLTGNKDVDRKILNTLEDKDLVNVCQVNKKAQSLCNDQVFWMNRVFLKFGYVGGDVLRANKGTDRTWSEYYIKDLRKINSTNADKYIRNGSKNGRLDHVIISLNIGANIHTYDALRFASYYGHLNVVKYLISAGANIHGNSDAALIVASEYGQTEVVKYLISAGADIHAVSDFALRLASINGHTEVVKYLISAGANIHAHSDEALISASENGHLDIVKYLISAGANIHADNDYALRSANANGHIEIVKYLISAGANWMETPMML